MSAAMAMYFDIKIVYHNKYKYHAGERGAAYERTSQYLYGWKKYDAPGGAPGAVSARLQGGAPGAVSARFI